MESSDTQEWHWGFKAMKLYLLALVLANNTTDFYKIKGAGSGDRASNEFMKNLRQLAKEHFGTDFSEKRVCKDTKHAFDFYIPDEGSVIEIALSLHNPGSEYEKDIFKCLLAKEEGLTINSLLFITKPGGMTRHEAAGSKRIRELVLKHFGIWVDILELMPSEQAEKMISRLKKCEPQSTAASQP